jgi:hypothetical protein
MSKLAWSVLGLVLAAPAVAQNAVPDLRGTWKGNSESVVSGGANPHHPAQAAEAQFGSVPFTLSVDKQEGRRISGTFSSAQTSDQVLAVIGRDGSIYMADDDGYTVGTILAPDRIELCYLRSTPEAKVASCTELTKQN